MKETAKEKAIREAWGQHWDFVSKNLNISGTAVRLQLWDTAGQ